MMKKIALWMAVTSLLCLCAGCGGAVPAPETEGPTETPTETPVNTAEVITYEVVEETLAETIRSGDEKDLTLMEMSFTLPKLEAYADGVRIETPETPEQTAALERVDAFNANFEQWLAEEDTELYAEAVKEHYAIDPGVFESAYYDEEFTYSAYRTGSLISVAATYYSYLGGAHPNTVFFAWNFDLESGDFLTIPELATDPQAFTLAVADLIEEQAETRFREELEGLGDGLTAIYWENYREIMEQWGSDYAASFDEEGLNVVFSAYELAPYAAGPQEFQIPYETLNSWWSPTGRAVLGLD